VENEFCSNLRSSTTYGEVLSDDRVIDLVDSAPEEKLEIIVHNGKQSLIVPKIEHDGVIYIPPHLHPTVRRAMRFPAGVSEYGSTVTLLWKVSRLCRRHLGLSEVFAATITYWVLTTWVPELFAAPPILSIAGSSMAQAVKFFRLLGALCRRAIIVAGLSQQLPLAPHPTLLVIEAGLTAKMRASWRACNYYGVYLPASSGALREMVCSKAIFSETSDAIGSWGEEALQIVLLPTNELLALTEQDQAEIAAEFQPQFELYRLRRLQPTSQSVGVSCPPEFAASGLGRESFALLAGEPDGAKMLLPIIEHHRQAITARRSLDPLTAILEAIWGPAHAQKQISTTEVQKRVNALLRDHGESLEYTAREIGWKLAHLDLSRRRAAEGMVLRFSRELRRRIHELARQFGLTLPSVNGCADCSPVQVVEQ
jgi:hypothetical protein